MSLHFVTASHARAIRGMAALKKLVALSIFMPALLLQAVEWENMPALPEGNGNFVCGAIDGALLVVGGIGWKGDVKHWRDTIWRFDSVHARWSEAGTLPQPLAYAAFGQAPAGIYFAGGSDGRQNDGELRLLGRALKLRTISRFEHPLCYSGSAIGGGKLFVVSGATDANDFRTLTNRCYTLDLRTGTATSLPDYPGGSLLLPAAATAGRQLYVFGGATWDAETSRAINTNAAFTYSVAEKKWKAIKPFPVAVRGLAACALNERYILLGGGYDDAFTNLAVIYDTKMDVYLEAKPLPFKAVAHFVKAGDFVYWLGGEHAMRQRNDAVYRIAWKPLLRDAQTARSKSARNR